jgi:molybdopterin converting factor subunit 1
MRVTVLYFAAARERAGTAREELELPDGSGASDALDAIVARHPELQPIAGKLRLAVDQDFAGTLRDGSEVALIPPVSGGAGVHGIGPARLIAEATAGAVAGEDVGAIVTFIGTVRGTNHGKQVVRLEYEAYAEMALRQFGLIAEEAAKKFHARVAIHHRTGPLAPGETSVIIAAASPHRNDAFEACRFAIEALKEDATIWKREVYPDGSTWVGLGS